MYIKSQIVLFTILGVVFRFAEANENKCGNLLSYKDIIQCALENHPDVNQGKLLLEQGKSSIAVAEQFQNPELGSQILSGKAGNDDYKYTQINLTQTIELGGKRSARVRRSEIQSDGAQTDLKLVQEDVYLKTFLSLVRLRQIKTEIDVLDQALSTFARVQKQYRGRIRMTPEQRATYSIMEIATNDYSLRRRPLVNESREIERFLEWIVGEKISFNESLYPAVRKQWPSISDSSLTNQVKSMSLQKSLMSLELAKAELDEAKGNSWPDLKLGPTFETQSQGSQNMNSAGVNLSVQIPLFQLNGAGRSYAKVGVARAQAALDAASKRENQQLKLSIEKYNDAVEALEKSITFENIQKKHAQVENSFDVGVVPSSLIIEIHRQMIDYTKTLDEQENTAIESLAKVYSLQGRLLSEGL